jgi:prepilin-type N-terminal cleavage/methylation domain-containing protein
MERHPARAPRRPALEGFTLVELMIVVAIVAILATVAGIAYVKHIKGARIVNAQQFMAEIAARQQAFYQQNAVYCNASGETGDSAVFHPGLVPGGEPQSHDWNVGSFTPAAAAAGWASLGARPDDLRTYASFFVRASLPPADPDANCPADDHARNAVAALPAIAIPPQPACPDPVTNQPPTMHPWYYAVAHLDMDGSESTYPGGGCANAGAAVIQTNLCTVLWVSSGRPSVVVTNDGK